MTRADILSRCEGEMIFMDGYDDCIVGVVERYGMEPVVCYDKQKVFDKLASYEVQLASQSNQLAAVLKNQSELLSVRTGTGNPMATLPSPSKSMSDAAVQTKAHSFDIRQQLEYKK